MAQLISSLTLSQSEDSSFTPSTLLIPKQLVLYFRVRSTFFKGTKYYFQHLIDTYAKHLILYNLHPLSAKWKKDYQLKGLDLQKKNFKPDPLLWEEFRHIGHEGFFSKKLWIGDRYMRHQFAYGITMCKLFTTLLELEYKRWMEAGCPENFQEKSPNQNEINKYSMNSTQKVFQNTGISLQNLLNDQNSTVLIRKIDFSRLKLDRFCLMKQD